MNHEELIHKLTDYHSMPKIKMGIEYVVQPPAVEATPVAENPTITAMRQTSRAFWELAQIHKEIGVLNHDKQNKNY